MTHQPSSPPFLVLYAGTTLFFLAYGVVNPDRLALSVGFFTLGLLGTWRAYLRWRRSRPARQA